uniref:Protein apterous-like isoform X1 n=1 Tax=Dermatophagoides pteronyssinus TaxID=6956 RepID=A0A6P6YC15_DERPT|nr:protein apterous-like isoform X1 [Dermatophagoides pteronyssinus]
MMTLDGFIHYHFFRFLGQTISRTYKDNQQAAIDINGIRNSKGIWLMAVQIDCYQCGRLIEPLELAFRIPYGRKQQLIHYHVRCFTCSKCSRQLQKGELYGLIINDHTFGLNVYCEQHYRQHQHRKQESQSSDGQQTFDQISSFSSYKCLNQDVECKMAKINESNSGESNRYSHQQNFNRLSTCGRIWTNNNNNEKRMRTSFQKCQLDLLHRCFKRTHKPNTDEMYHLVQQTQLSKRVLQIWFQNQRSKWTRLMMSRPPIVGPIKVMASKVAAESFSQNIAIIDQKQQ